MWSTHENTSNTFRIDIKINLSERSRDCMWPLVSDAKCFVVNQVRKLCAIKKRRIQTLNRHSYCTVHISDDVFVLYVGRSLLLLLTRWFVDVWRLRIGACDACRKKWHTCSLWETVFCIKEKNKSRLCVQKKEASHVLFLYLFVLSFNILWKKRARVLVFFGRYLFFSEEKMSRWESVCYSIKCDLNGENPTGS